MNRAIDSVRMDKSQLSIGHLHDPPGDAAYWRTRSVQERFAGVEILRQIMYDYDPATARIQRVLEIAQLHRG